MHHDCTSVGFLGVLLAADKITGKGARFPELMLKSDSGIRQRGAALPLGPENFKRWA